MANDYKKVWKSARVAMACALGSLAMPIAAENARWFQVELMVFVQPSGTLAEHWPPTPVLDYPDDIQFLVPGDAPAEQAPDTDDGAVAAEAPVAQAPSASDEWQLPTPFRLLPRANLEFAGKAAYMQRVGGYRILFHETWAQPVSARAQSRAIIVDSASDSPWPELQGSIRLSLARYLHLETDLWLNTQGDYLSPGWNMPAPPRSPSRPPVPASAAAMAEPAPTQSPEASTWGPEDEAFLLHALAEEDPVYPYRHAVLMQQKRRMRSKEVHYIDHPLLGVVAKLTPLDEETLHALALAESTGESVTLTGSQ